MRPKIPAVILDLFPKLDEEKDETCDNKVELEHSTKVLNPNPGKSGDSNGAGDPIWVKIYEIETTPALSMIWAKTSTQNRLMKLLKIDPRNIVSITQSC